MHRFLTWWQKLPSLFRRGQDASHGFKDIDNAIQNGRPDLALNGLQNLPDSRKYGQPFLERLARAYQDLQYWQEASDAWMQLLKLGPASRNAEIPFAMTQYELGHIEKARNALTLAANSPRTKESALLSLLDIERRQKNWQAAEDLLLALQQTKLDRVRLQSLAFNIAIQQHELTTAQTILVDGAAKGCVPHPALDKLELSIAARNIEDATRLVALAQKDQLASNNTRFKHAVLQLHELNRDYDKAIALLEVEVQTSNQNPLAIADLARMFIIDNQTDRAVHEIDRIPSAWDRHRRIAPLRAFSLTQKVSHQDAKDTWNRIHFWSALHTHPSLSAPVPPVAMGKRVTGKARVKLYTSVRDEELRLPWFLSYYRSIGIEEFYIIDNGSTDSTTDYLQNQDDVALFQTHDSFRDSLGGTYWINYLIKTYGAEDWVLYVDVDEFLQLPGLQVNGIDAIISELESRGDEAVFAPMLDMFPEFLENSRTYSAGDDPLSSCPYFDNSLEIFGQVESPYKKVHGGASERFAKQKGIDVLTKTPLFHAKKGIKLFYISHKTTPAKVSSMTGALLHFKFLGPFVEFLQNETERNDHFGVNRRYALLADNLGNNSQAESLIGPNTVKFESPAQLIELGVISNFAD